MQIDLEPLGSSCMLKTKFNHSVPGVSSIGPAEFDKLNSGRCGRRRCSRGSSQRSKSRGG